MTVRVHAASRAIVRLATGALALSAAAPAFAQDEASLRAANAAQLAAARAGDSAALGRLAAPSFIINS